jgi:hypothetical protein
MIVEENDSESDDETRNFKDNLLLNKFKQEKKSDNRPFASNKNNNRNNNATASAQQKSSQAVKQNFINK